MREILVVCEGVVIKMSLEIILRNAGIPFRLVEHDEKAFSAAVDKYEPNLALFGCARLDEFGVDEIRALVELQPDVPLLVACISSSEKQDIEAIRAGARGLITCEAEFKLIPKAVKAVAAGELWCPRTVLQRVLERYREPPLGGVAPAETGSGLTKREKEVFPLVARGYKNKEIAEELGISYNTVVSHVYNLYRKLGISSRKEAILYTAQHLSSRKP